VLTGVKRKPFTQEHKDNIRKSKLGKEGPNKGKIFTEEHKKNIGLSSKGRIDGDKNPMKKKEVIDKKLLPEFVPKNPKYSIGLTKIRIPNIYTSPL
jgi:hypothetical protein